MSKVNLEQFAGGALQEKFDHAFEQVVHNMQDPNTPYKNKRSINIKISFTQNEERDDSSVEIAVETKLAAASPLHTNFAIGTDLRTGEIFAEEYGPYMKGQVTLGDLAGEEEKNITEFKKTKEA